MREPDSNLETIVSALPARDETKTTISIESQWQAVVKRELRATGSIILALSRCRQKYPQLWAAVNAPRTEHRQMELEFEQQTTDRVERQR